MPNNYKEIDLKTAITNNLKDFILEIGKDFSLAGQEYRIQVGGRHFISIFYSTISILEQVQHEGERLA